VAPMMSFVLLIAGAQSLSQAVVVQVLRSVLHNLPPIAVPDVSVTGIGGFYANATNITLVGLDLKNVTLSITDATHMTFGLTGVSGSLSFNLANGDKIIHNKNKVTGSLLNTALTLKFLVNGDAMLSSVSISIGKLDLKLPDDKFMQLLVDLFLPTFKLAVEAAVPPVIMAHKEELDFFHLVRAIVDLVPKLPLPELTIKEVNQTIVISDIVIQHIDIGSESVVIAAKNHLYSNLGDVSARGALNYRVEKNGAVTARGVGSLVVNKATVKIEASVIGTGAGFDVHYVDAKLAIGYLFLDANTPDTFVKWLVESMSPFLKNFLEESFPPVVQLILG